MNNNQNQPREFDVVLGGENPAPVTGVVLGGIEGVKRRLESENEEARIAAIRDALNYEDEELNLLIKAIFEEIKERLGSDDESNRIAGLKDALNYGDEGLSLLVQALNNYSGEIYQDMIWRLRKSGYKGKKVLLNYNPWLVLATFRDWKDEHWFGGHNIDSPTYGGCYVSNKKSLIKVINHSEVKKIKSLKCEMYYRDRNYKTAFQDFVDTIVEAKDSLVNLKALRIGDECVTYNVKYLNSRISVCNIYPILAAYPKLKLLHIRGKMYQEDVFIPDNKILAVHNIKNKLAVSAKTFKHESLKTLIIDADGISDKNLAKLCNLDLPSLEYLEIWLNRGDSHNISIQSLAPILAGKYCQNLVYLAIRNSKNTTELVKAIVDSPIINSLKILEITDGNIRSDGARALLESPAIDRLHTLNVSASGLDANTIEKLSQLNCRVITEASHRYYSVWE
ncbi:pentapeptide repeat protein [Calothrix parasitica NIES-267]|uniref:Pentapeptide repeat protein n=1 Tax=Calothrix parasitica NIES-267 TaxID=1973488 RepID=A0A1Z4LN61_9CYAN|nr:pentapeptide repeat protein [Calothrix parasitica NIES-267]